MKEFKPGTYYVEVIDKENFDKCHFIYIQILVNDGGMIAYRRYPRWDYVLDVYRDPEKRDFKNDPYLDIDGVKITPDDIIDEKDFSPNDFAVSYNEYKRDVKNLKKKFSPGEFYFAVMENCEEFIYFEVVSVDEGRKEMGALLYTSPDSCTVVILPLLDGKYSHYTQVKGEKVHPINETHYSYKYIQDYIINHQCESSNDYGA